MVYCFVEMLLQLAKVKISTSFEKGGTLVTGAKPRLAKLGVRNHTTKLKTGSAPKALNETNGGSLCQILGMSAFVLQSALALTIF